ncbi:MAG: alpha/beta hydrolase [Gammaproteobacteria bacterium]|nr:MAG: alpha/beta hydrolase [Gammaproteobacteria bacterium]
MPIIKINDADIYYQDFNENNSEETKAKETIVFAHGLLWDNEMFAPQIEQLKSKYRCIAFDFRGQGKSESTESGYDMGSLALDTKLLIETLVDGPVHFLGLSMGGFIGMRLAIHHPELLKSLMLLETTADPEPEANKPKYRKLAFIAKWISVGLIVDKTMAIMFSQSFLNDPNKIELKNEWIGRLKNLNRWTFGKAVKGVIDRNGIYGMLPKIELPTLIVVGDEDVATTPAKAQRMHDAIKGSSLVIIEKAGHTSSIEQPEAITKAIREFLR